MKVLARFGKDLLGNDRVGIMSENDATQALMNGAKIHLGGI